MGAYRGDGVIILPKFEFKSFLETIQTYKISNLYLVPPIIITITKSRDVVKQYDLSSVNSIFTGAAPLGEETAEDLQSMFPGWAIRQGYGMTESATVVCSTIPSDVYFGSSGSLLPGIEARELWVKGPAITLGYLNNQKATGETFVDGYLRTGDEAVVRKHPKSGHEHIFIVDRLKELIKVNVRVFGSTLLLRLLTRIGIASGARRARGTSSHASRG